MFPGIRIMLSVLLLAGCFRTACAQETLHASSHGVLQGLWNFLAAWFLINGDPNKKDDDNDDDDTDDDDSEDEDDK